MVGGKLSHISTPTTAHCDFFLVMDPVRYTLLCKSSLLCLLFLLAYLGILRKPAKRIFDQKEKKIQLIKQHALPRQAAEDSGGLHAALQRFRAVQNEDGCEIEARTIQKVRAKLSCMVT